MRIYKVYFNENRFWKKYLFQKDEKLIWCIFHERKISMIDESVSGNTYKYWCIFILKLKIIVPFSYSSQF